MDLPLETNFKSLLQKLLLAPADIVGKAATMASFVTPSFAFALAVAHVVYATPYAASNAHVCVDFHKDCTEDGEKQQNQNALGCHFL